MLSKVSCRRRETFFNGLPATPLPSYINYFLQKHKLID